MSIRVLEEILRQVTELRRKQDGLLDSAQRRSAYLSVWFLPISAAATALLASPALDTTSQELAAAGFVALLVAAMNGICWVAVHDLTTRWHEGPDTEQLARDFPNRTDGYRALLRHLIDLYNDHYERNKRPMRRARGWVGAQIAINFAAICVLVAALSAVR